MSEEIFVKNLADKWETLGLKLDMTKNDRYFFLVERMRWCKCDPVRAGVFGTHNYKEQMSKCQHYEETVKKTHRKYDFNIEALANSTLNSFGLRSLPVRINNKQAGQIEKIILLAHGYKNGVYDEEALKRQADDIIRN